MASNTTSFDGEIVYGDYGAGEFYQLGINQHRSGGRVNYAVNFATIDHIVCPCKHLIKEGPKRFFNKL